MPPRELRIPARDGYPLAATLHAPEEDRAPRALVVVATATAVPRTYYDAFGAFLARRGFLALAYDNRGVGGSRPDTLRGFRATMTDWGVHDMAGVFAWAAKEHGDLPLLLVGHSVGGQLVGLAEGADRLAGVVSVGSQSGDWRLWPAPTRWARAFQWYVASPLVVPLVGKLPKWVLGEELPAGVALEWARWCRSRDFLMVDDGARRREQYARLRVPWLAFSFGDDDYGPHRTTDALMAYYPNVRVERRRVEPTDVGQKIGHFGFFRPRFEATLWRETADWLARCGR